MHAIQEMLFYEKYPLSHFLHYVSESHYIQFWIFKLHEIQLPELLKYPMAQFVHTIGLEHMLQFEIETQLNSQFLDVEL